MEITFIAPEQTKKKPDERNLRLASVCDYHSLPYMIAQRERIRKACPRFSPILRNFIHRHPKISGDFYRFAAGRIVFISQFSCHFLKKTVYFIVHSANRQTCID